jgi:osmotically inducible protein OsmC
MEIAYTAIAHATGGGRDGHVRSEDDLLDLDTRPPKEMGGNGEGTNPEQLFAAGFAACFHSALKLVARGEKVDVSESAITARVGLGMQDSGAFNIAVELEAELPDVERSVAEALVAKAHTVCPYSNATRGNVDVTLTIH